MIQRRVLGELRHHLKSREISLIVGPRQAGKTTLMLLLKEELDRQGAHTLLLNLDVEADQPSLASQEALLNKIQLEFGRAKTGYVFLDEIQRKENAGRFLKGLYDLRLPWKFIVSGSGSLELKERIHESLVGRKRIFAVGTLSFEEFVHCKTADRYRSRLTRFLAAEPGRAAIFLQEYLRFGGYPRVVLAASLQEKRMVMEDIYRSYVERDLAVLLRVEKLEAFSTLLKVLAGQIGQLINVSELSSTLGIAVKTVQNYLWYAQQTFVLHRVTPYFRNARTELTKAPVAYFHDLGLRNYALGLWGVPPSPPDQGWLFQNFVFRLLHERCRRQGWQLHFWRTKDKAEVDFVIEAGSRLIPVEVKYRNLRHPHPERSLRSFLVKYRPPEAWIVHLGSKARTRVGPTTVRLVPFGELITNEED